MRLAASPWIPCCGRAAFPFTSKRRLPYGTSYGLSLRRLDPRATPAEDDIMVFPFWIGTSRSGMVSHAL